MCADQERFVSGWIPSNLNVETCSVAPDEVEFGQGNGLTRNTGGRYKIERVHRFLQGLRDFTVPTTLKALWTAGERFLQAGCPSRHPNDGVKESTEELSCCCVVVIYKPSSAMPPAPPPPPPPLEAM